MRGERTVEEQRHARECFKCRGELERLEKAFSLFRESGRLWGDHWRLSSQSRWEHPQSGGRQRLPQWGRIASTGALAASLVVGVFLMRRPAPVPHSDEAPCITRTEPFVQTPCTL